MRKPRVRGYQPTVVDGIRFHSKKEARRYQELKLLERAGQISNLERQVKIELHGKSGPILTEKGNVMSYIADFRYVDWDLGGAWVIEDAKGFRTDLYKLKKAILKAQGITITET